MIVRTEEVEPSVLPCSITSASCKSGGYPCLAFRNFCEEKSNKKQENCITEG